MIMGNAVCFNFGVLISGSMSLSYLSPKIIMRDGTLGNAKFIKFYSDLLNFVKIR